MIDCLKQHAEDRGLGYDSPYWICAYANNQWKFTNEVSADPNESSFHKAMSFADGTVSIVDNHCVVYNRIWCNYETHISIMENSSEYLFDMYT